MDSRSRYTDPGDSNVERPPVPDSQDENQVGMFETTKREVTGNACFCTYGSHDPRCCLNQPAPLARNTDPGTSHDAAASMVEEAKAQRGRILGLLRFSPKRPDWTADEIDTMLGELLDTHWPRTTAGRRLPELERMGLVRRLEATRPTRSGRNAHLWEIV